MQSSPERMFFGIKTFMRIHMIARTGTCLIMVILAMLYMRVKLGSHGAELGDGL